MTTTQGERNGRVESGTTEAKAHYKDRARGPARARLRVEEQGRASAPVSVPSSASPRFCDRLWRWWLSLWGRLAACSPYADRPASIRDVVAYTRAGGWVPGDHPWWVEAPGTVYGWVIAVPVTVVIYAVAWVIQRPSRVAMLGLVCLLLRWASRG